MRKIVFLDVDGVLNCADWFRVRSRERRDMTYADLLVHATDPACVSRLNMITERTDALIVLSSSWRHAATWEETATVLTERRGMTGTMIGRTPLDGEVDERVFARYQRRRPKEGEPYPRGYEIQQWLDGHPPCRFVILDDDDDMEHLGPRLVQTDWDGGGLQLGHVRRAIAMLNR